MFFLATLLAVIAPTSPEPLHVATYAYPAYDRSQALAPLARLIEDTTGRSVEITLYETPEELASAIREGRVDVAMTNLAAFIETSRDPAVRAIAVLSVPAETLERYRGVLLARREIGARAPADLRGIIGRLRYTEVLPGSTSGALVQAAAFRRARVDRAGFRSIEQAGTHDAALTRLLSSQTDVAALAETPWRMLQSARPEDAGRLIELWRSTPLPPGPLVCYNSSRIRCDKIATALLLESAASREVAAALAKGWSETAGAVKFRRTDRQDYITFVPATTHAFDNKP